MKEEKDEEQKALDRVKNSPLDRFQSDENPKEIKPSEKEAA